MKNYIYLIIVFCLSILLSIWMINFYKSNILESEKNIFLEKPYNQIKVSELSDYLIDKANITIYITNTTTSKEFNEDFGSYLTSKNLVNEVVFVDGKDLMETDISYFKSIYEGEVNFSLIDFEKDQILTLEERQITDFITVDDITNIDIIDAYFTKNKVLND